MSWSFRNNDIHSLSFCISLLPTRGRSIIRASQDSDGERELVLAVADANGKPIVIGAEVIKVVGPVHAGDLLVASAVPGYAVANSQPAPGAVIAQALEDLDGERGLIRAMIRKF
jgi:hypothetical protein